MEMLDYFSDAEKTMKCSVARMKKKTNLRDIQNLESLRAILGCDRSREEGVYVQLLCGKQVDGKWSLIFGGKLDMTVDGWVTKTLNL